MFALAYKTLSGGHAQILPIGRLVATPGILCRIYKSLDQNRAVSPATLPIIPQTPYNLSQNVTGKILDFNPRKNQEPTVVDYPRQVP
jgi:hypothetical protein